MNSQLKYFLIFAPLVIIVVYFAISFADNIDTTAQNPDSYTVNSSEIITANGHIIICTYKENQNFAYILGCFQQDR